MNGHGLFTGASTALITPFDGGRVDIEAFRGLIRYQLDGGISSLTVCGTTGEAPTLGTDERRLLFRTAVAEAGGRAPIVAGVGSNDTKKAAELSSIATEEGCDALLAVTPYYNRASDDGLYLHYMRIAEASPLPVILYNVPSRTGINAPIGTVKRLFDCGAIVAVKEASGDVSRLARLLEAVPGLTVYSGNDDLILPTLAMGGRGVISVLANILPQETEELCRLCLGGRMREAQAEARRLLPLTEALFSEVNPVPVKYLASRLGLCRAEYRLPLTEPAAETAKRLDSLFVRYFG